IHQFMGNYDDYIRERENQRFSLEQEIHQLHKQKKDMHTALMKEQNRAAKSRSKGEKSIGQKKWPTVVSSAKAERAGETTGRKKSTLKAKKQGLIEELSSLHLPEIIVPAFSLNSADIGNKTILSIREGIVAYGEQKPLLENIHL